ncbi:MAG: hypothetical protein IPJ17_02935 [Holophagales bacterium]|nr:MAG: hypothetical protein IPJ17_02935 [Holophagales bacterium]
MNEPTMVAVDPAKSVFEAAVFMRPGQVRPRRRLSRVARWPRATPASR